MMQRAIYAGTFDPIHYGHLNIINRSLDLFNEIIIALGTNTAKNTLFTLEERVNLVQETINEEFQALSDHIHVLTYSDLTVKFAKSFGNCCLVRAVRNTLDFEYESNVAEINKALAPGLETVLLLADSSFTHVSSSMVREVAGFGHDVSKFVPKSVLHALNSKLQK